MERLRKKTIAFRERVNEKKFIKIFLFSILLFLCYHAFVWFFWTSKLLNPPLDTRIGDLSRVGYDLSTLQPRLTINTLPKKHIEFSEWKGEKIDLVTIGDSFSNGGAGGQNAFYQDYLCSHYNLTILNINPSLFGENYIEAIVALYKSGILDMIKPKAILIESLENYLYKRFAHPIVWDQNITKETLISDLRKGYWGNGKPHKEKNYFISTANYKLPIYQLFYHFSPNALGYSSANKVSLKQPLFSNNASSTLLFHEHDITSIYAMTSDNTQLINQNFNTLSALLATKKIDLMVMFVVSKYDLYSDYVENNPFPKNPFFNQISSLDKNYIFINTKAILSEELRKGTKDIFFADDTHWSHKASQIISSSRVFTNFYYLHNTNK